MGHQRHREFSASSHCRVHKGCAFGGQLGVGGWGVGVVEEFSWGREEINKELSDIPHHSTGAES